MVTKIILPRQINKRSYLEIWKEKRRIRVNEFIKKRCAKIIQKWWKNRKIKAKEVVKKANASLLLSRFMKGKKVANVYEEFRIEMKQRQFNEFFENQKKKQQTDAQIQIAYVFRKMQKSKEERQKPTPKPKKKTIKSKVRQEIVKNFKSEYS